MATVSTLYVDKDGVVKANPGMEYPNKPEAKYEHNKAGIYRHTQWYKETGGYKDPTKWFNDEVTKWKSGLLPFEDQDIAWAFLISQTSIFQKNPINRDCFKPDTIVHISPIEVGVKQCEGQCAVGPWEPRFCPATRCPYAVLRIKN